MKKTHTVKDKMTHLSFIMCYEDHSEWYRELKLFSFNLNQIERKTLPH